MSISYPSPPPNKDTKQPPPLGLKPLRVHVEQRMIEVEAAIQRYVLAGMPIKSEWVYEWAELRRNLDTPFRTEKFITPLGNGE